MAEFRIKAISGVRWSTAGTVLKAAIYLIQMTVLARLLEPADFGLMAIVFAVIGLALLVTDLGTSNFIISSQDISPSQLSSLFWMNILSGICVSAVLYLSSLGLAKYYQELKLQQLLRLASALFLVVPLGLQFAALMQKQLRFKIITAIETAAVLCNLVISIFLAVKGHGVYSLMAGVMAQYVLSAVLFLLLGLRTYRIQPGFSPGDVQSYVKFGLYQTASGLMSYFNFQLDIIIIGRLFGPELLGFFSLAKNIALKPLELINPAVIRVAYPVLSQYQSDRAKQNNLYLSFINNLSSITFPIYAAIGIMAEPIVGLLLGDKWGSVVPLLRILAVYSAARSVWQPSGTLMLSKGRADLHFYWSGLMLLLIPATVLLGYRWGIMGVALCLMAGQLLALLPNYIFWIRPVASIGYGAYGRSLGRPLLLAAASGIVSYGVVFWIPSPGPRAALFAAVFLLIYYFTSRIFNHSFIRDVRQVLIPSG
ncbi:MAG: hypothetical protein A2509_10890 [Candidatus Edwardsbacteria bacterium RIFOXYD12_FULL_50_11]|nr:MAG: hypothetical protein A2502_03760 [Candidatus Edwardsbacteria bacterium RifOxyC12_full_54_24]OGF08164.1 MAG: hypothetical protein A2273_07390 [Candidatus Edwardsbacteria bacterium RifOxyA12_full_54_48]OGF11461.1 MAG: hypothetical protein A3K15_03860 [Candidatus Edwardsbacteria bacterium GWE2_54_12]OGF14763.1 MAG: hypothetical protein A2509_10890 [Candidatus Edwardsbacteria bacterium RIFOXYD12_FULL_50_11]OGJ17293.1 MAG: hypothetical protein A2349_02000 [Candidatus Edwardsbacteria bacteriu